MIRRLIILLLIVGCVFAREYIAIIDFEGISVSEADAKALTQRLTSEMIKLELYQVLERSEMKRLLDEQKFQYSGCVDLKCAVELGKMLGAKYMVVGSVSKVGSSYSIDSRMIDVETSEAYISANFTHKGEIDILLTSGIVSIAKQLCELEDNPQITLTPTTSPPPPQVTLTPTPSKNISNSTKGYIAYQDDTKPTSKSEMVLSDYYFRGHRIELIDNTIKYGRFLGTNSKMLYFVGANMITSIECNKVINIYDSQDIEIPFNCNDNTFNTN